MYSKNYILSIVEPESNRAYSTLISRTRCALIFLIISVIFFLMSFPLAIGLRRVQTHLHLQRLKRKNTILIETFASWERKINNIESKLKDLHKMNRDIQVYQTSSSTDIEYGVGGHESISQMGLIELPEVKKAELDLTQLAAKTERLMLSMIELERTISSRMEQIAHYPSVKPVRGGWISSPFGKRIDPFTEKSEDHQGIDISIKPGSKVYAPASGIIKAVRTEVIKNKGYGKYILIDHGFGYETVYGHLFKVFVKKGQKVKRWDIIGLTGNTGKSTSPHLHYGVIVSGTSQNPINFILE